MGRLLCLAAALSAAGCGKVAGSTAAVPDGPDPDALVCTSPQLECSGTCVDPMTTHDHCGTCDTACVAGVDCLAGHCTDTTESCAAIKQYSSSTPANGIFTHTADGSTFYCDFNTGVEYDELGFGLYNSFPAGFTMLTVPDLQTASTQQAFIALFNQQKGLTLIAPFTNGNCCFKQDTAAGATGFLLMNAMAVFPATNLDATACNTTQTDPGHFYLFASSSYSTDHIADDFFTAHPVTAGTMCSVMNNAAMFWRER